MVKTRPRRNALVYLRKSTKKQESSLQMQLEWAITEAARSNVTLDASSEDLQRMQVERLTKRKGIRLDEGISGADLSRPGLAALLTDIKADSSISHVFVHMADRLARPEFSEDGVSIENAITSLGVTIVFSNRVSSPRRRGTEDFAQSIQKLIDYQESGTFLEKLATRVIECQQRLARQGHWTGGRAPYGFKRVRVFPDGSEVDLEDGTSMKSPGSHTELRIADSTKIEVWVSIIEMCAQKGWGAKRIANELNTKGISSPDAGRYRTENGHRHKVSGRWSASSVRGLLNNTIITGLLQYGVRSEGRWRRVDCHGPRALDYADYAVYADYINNKKTKVVLNGDDVIVKTPLKGVEAMVSAEDFGTCQRILEERGRHQRGIPRCPDPSRYPLATRVWDLNCAGPMYGRRSGSRHLYVCGAYLKDQSCEHNNVDGDALLSFVGEVLRQSVNLSGRELLIRKLQEFAEAERQNSTATIEPQMQELRNRMRTVQQEVELISKNLARAKDDAEYEAVRLIFKANRAELERIEQDLAKETERARRQADADPDAEIAAALSVLDNMSDVLADRNARVEFGHLIRQLNLNVWLNFASDRKGRRLVRKLLGGIITTGNALLPVTPYDKTSAKDAYDTNGGGTFPTPSEPANVSPAPNPSQGEDVSFTKVTRGD